MKDVGGAWEFFSKISQDKSYPIDLGTYHVLLKGLHTHLLNNGNGMRTKHEYPSPRKLFNHMVRYYLNNPKAHMPYEERPSGPMYARIIRCFCLANDSVGALLAVHGLKHVFAQNPTPAIIEHFVKNISYRFFFRDRRRYDLNSNKALNKLRRIAYEKAAARVLIAMHRRMRALRASKKQASEAEYLDTKDTQLTESASPIDVWQSLDELGRSLDGEESTALLASFMKKSLAQTGIPISVDEQLAVAKEHMGLNLLDEDPS